MEGQPRLRSRRRPKASDRPARGRRRSPTSSACRRVVLVDAEGNERGRLDVDDRGNPGLRLWHPGGFMVDLRCDAEAAGLTIDHSKREDPLVAALTAYSQSDLGLHGYGVLTLNDDGADAADAGNGHTMQAEHLAELRSVNDWMTLRGMPEDVRHEATLLGTARRGMTDRQWAQVRDLISAGFRAAVGADAEARKAVAAP